MKSLVCEMCGGNDLLKDGGVFVCQSCGCKYTVEEAKKLMVDGVVEVTGTVKVDNREEIKNIIINAGRAFDDHQYDKAEALYSTVLNSDPNNTEAIYKQGLCIAWRSSENNNQLGVAKSALKRAFEIEFSKDESADSKVSFFCAAVAGYMTIVISMLKMCDMKIGQLSNHADESAKRVAYFAGKKTEIYDVGDRAISRIKNEALDELNDISGKLRDNTIQYIIMSDDVLSQAFLLISDSLSYFSDSNVYKAKHYETLELIVNGFEQTVRLQDERAKAHHQKINSPLAYNTIKKQLNKYKKQVVKEYWDEHADKKTELENEKKEIQKKLSELDGIVSSIKEGNKEARKELHKETKTKLPCEEELHKQEEVIKDLESQIKGCNIFKGKLKKELTSKLEEQELPRLEELKKQVDLEKKERKKKIDAEIQILDDQENQYVDEIGALRNRLREIKELLNSGKPEKKTGKAKTNSNEFNIQSERKKAENLIGQLDKAFCGTIPIFCIDSNHTVQASHKKFDLHSWSDVSMICCDYESEYLLGLKSDGTVIAAGENGCGQCNVDKWKDIASIVATTEYSIGIGEDGGVSFAGEIGDLREIDNWSDIKDIAIGCHKSDFIVGLKNNGKCVLTGDSSLKNVTQWEDITQISCFYDFVVGLRGSGEIELSGRTWPNIDFSNWKNITKIISGQDYFIGLKKDGSVVLTAEDETEFDVSNWSDIIDIAAGTYHAIGLKSDGTVVATGSNKYGQCNVGQLKEIVAIYANGATITTCLDKNGLVHFVGKDELKGLSWNKKIKLF